MAGQTRGAWRKLGLLFAGPSKGHHALVSHAALPVPYTLEGDLVRIFYSGRDAANRSSVGTIVARLGETPRVEDQSTAPVLMPGETGGFDDAGIGIGCIVPGKQEDRLYYMGWNVGGAVPWRNSIGVAFGNAREGRFEKRFLGPILDRSILDPYSLSYPNVLQLGPREWRMWYGTHLQWGSTQADMSHAIRAATSTDGLEWRPDEKICMAPQGDEIATVRPSVMRIAPHAFEMYFALRGLNTPYSIGKATGVDGHRWHRVDAGIVPDGPGWEGNALTYPAVKAGAILPH
ncbi:hypothetical protein FNL56_20060 [Tardiphaga sp. vice304]|uniref:hypothetical protein n=1 Tax=Tardiphaga sp. vice304 TaxID=2592817 RepID=UPI0011647DB0|nr:hypothetical protein [Tardiphaga sp. vice304]QDM28166.1 hypothetical protein FNL56_20060 [Tardiphaga sp. vice304]